MHRRFLVTYLHPDMEIMRSMSVLVACPRHGYRPGQSEPSRVLQSAQREQ